MEREQNFLESYKNAEKIGVLEQKVNRRSFLFAGLLSVIGVTTAGSYFFPTNRAGASGGPNAILGNGSLNVGNTDYTIDNSTDLNLKEKGVPTSGAVKSFIEKKILDTIKDTFSKEGLPANFVKINQNTLTFNANNIQQAIEILDERTELLEKDTHKPVSAADSSITVDAPAQKIKVNPSGISFSATINGGIVTNLQEFLNVSTATLNTITALGGVSEGVNEGQLSFTNRADIFNRKDGTRFYFRTLVSSNNSVSFAQAGDGKTIDLQVNVQNNSITTNQIVDNSITTTKIVDNSITTSKIVDNSITTTKIADGNVTLQKLSPITRQRLLGNNDVGAGTGAVEEINLDPQTLRFDGSGNLAVRTGLGGINLSTLDGDLTWNQIQNLPGQTLLGNGNPTSASPEQIALNPSYFIFSGSPGNYTLSLNTSFVGSITTPFVTNTNSRVEQVNSGNRVDIGPNPGAVSNSALNVFAVGDSLSLIGTNSIYMTFHPQGYSPGLSGNTFVGHSVANGDAFVIDNRNSADQSILLNPTSAGRLGIATSAPLERLRVGSHLFYHDGGEKNLSWNSYFDGNWRKANTGTAYQWNYTASDPNSSYVLRASTTSAANSTHGWLNALVVDQNALVGVGTGPTSGYQLTVLGSQRSLGRIDINRSGATSPYATNNSVSINEDGSTNPRIGFHKAGNAEGWLDFNGGTFTFGRDQVAEVVLASNGGVRAAGGAPNGFNGFSFNSPEVGADTGMFNTADGQLDLYTNSTRQVFIRPTGKTIFTGKGNNDAQVRLEPSADPFSLENGDLYHGSGSLRGYFVGLQRTFTGLVYSNTAFNNVIGGTGTNGSLLQTGFEEYGTKSIPLSIFLDRWRILRIKLSGGVSGSGNDQAQHYVRFATGSGIVDFPFAPFYNPAAGINEQMFPAGTTFNAEVYVQNYSGSTGLYFRPLTSFYANSSFKSYQGSFYSTGGGIPSTPLTGIANFDIGARIPFSASGSANAFLYQVTVEILN